MYLLGSNKNPNGGGGGGGGRLRHGISRVTKEGGFRTKFEGSIKKEMEFPGGYNKIFMYESWLLILKFPRCVIQFCRIPGICKRVKIPGGFSEKYIPQPP